MAVVGRMLRTAHMGHVTAPEQLRDRQDLQPSFVSSDFGIRLCTEYNGRAVPPRARIFVWSYFIVVPLLAEAAGNGCACVPSHALPNDHLSLYRPNLISPFSHLLLLLLLEKHACQHRIVTDRTRHSRSPGIPGHLMLSMRRRRASWACSHMSPERLSYSLVKRRHRSEHQGKATRT